MTTPAPTKALIRELRNKHVSSCGEPPEWVSAKDGLFSYFENGIGEQWVSLLTKDELRVAGGDINWKTLTVSRQADVGLIQLRLVEALARRESGEFCGMCINREETEWCIAVLEVAISIWGSDA